MEKLKSAEISPKPVQLDFEMIKGDFPDEFRLYSPAGAVANCWRGASVRTEAGEVTEPNVLYVEDLEVAQSQQGSGIGTELLRQCVETAKEEGFSFVRMGVINPHVINMAETMVKDGNAHFAAYSVDRGGPYNMSQLPTEQVFDSPNRVGADEAIKILEKFEREDEEARARGEDYDGDVTGVTAVLIVD